jgi:hypoxanthine phosphoribosyltransferase
MRQAKLPAALQPLYSRAAIARRVKEIAQVLSRAFAGREPIVIGVLKGAFIFVADLVRAMDLAVKVDFVQVASYGLATTPSGTVTLVKDLSLDVEGQDVILVDDILDTGRSLHFLVERVQQRRPRSLTVCVLIDKHERRQVEVAVDHVGFVLAEGFVVGYGIDQGEAYRNLDGLYIMKTPRGRG